MTTLLEPEREPDPAPRATFWRILLVLPFVATLWVPFFNFRNPEIFGFPFFYWYQLVWVIVSAAIIWIVWRAES
jgi:hypothetical protein